MSGRRSRILSIAMYVAAALCCLRAMFRLLSPFALNPILLIDIVLWNGILAVLLVLGARLAWAQGGAPGKITLTDLE